MKDKTKLGKYEILEELGRGGFGVVYMAKDSVLQRSVAVKALHPALLVDPQFIERFKNEARIAALLDHPNLVPVYDFGQEDGQFYLVMAYMPGGSLSKRLKAS
ncbi:MAG: protein kinase, partial [Chloroflexota bacterium]|nr:protein kinase [Chloroflexota bacterium]